jgi:transposase InsO family protein
VWAAFCRQVGIKHIMTTAYHPQSNGMVECVHRKLKAALRSRNCGTDWAEHLPWVLMGIRAAPKDDTGVSSAELV